MENSAQPDLIKFPIGPFVKKDTYSAEELNALIADIENAPDAYKKIAATLAASDLSKTYRQGSWDIQQLIHHVADIQLLHFFRMKRAVTEADYKDVTLISMDGWADTADGKQAPVNDSILMLEGITKRYVYLIRSLSAEQLQISYYHPVRGFHINQVQAVAMSAWHLQHHLAHINLALRG